MTKRRKLILGVAGVSGAFLMSACGGEKAAPPLGTTYDLADYLFPKESGTQLYRVWESIKKKGETSYPETEYKKQQNDLFDINGTIVREKKDGIDVARYTIDDDTITVLNIKDKLGYHFDKRVSTKGNFVQEESVKRAEVGDKTLEVTYECQISKHINEMILEPETYRDVIEIMCIQKESKFVTIDETKFERLVERKETYFATKEKGVISDVVEICKYSSIENEAQTENGCEKRERKLLGFVPK